jgi:hypothetical protein
MFQTITVTKRPIFENRMLSVKRWRLKNLPIRKIKAKKKK